MTKIRKKREWPQRKVVNALFSRVRLLHLVLIIACVILTLSPLLAQEPEGPRRGSSIVDDSTRQIYGPTTSRFFYEEDVFFNQQVYYPIDTVIRNFHRYTYVQQYNNLYQDLGNIGTAIRPVFYEVPQYIGANPGFESFDLYWGGNRIRYFDTKSPYTNMKVSLGGRGRSLTNVAFSRNINPRWNFGFNYRGLFIDKQVQRRGKGDRNVRSTYYDLYTTYQNKDSTYRLFLNYARNRHQVIESGGILLEDRDNFQLADFFDVNAGPVLTAAQSRELRMNLHLFHQYEVGRALQVYHTFDRYRQGNDFVNTQSDDTDRFFGFVEIDSTSKHDVSRFVTVRNEAGIKGNLLKLFYNGYYAVRNYSMDYKYLSADTLAVKTQGQEHYLGGRIALQLDSLIQLRGWVEVMENGNFRIEGSLKSKWLEASLEQNKYSPGFLHQAYRGSHHVWNNNFSSVDVTQLNGFIHYRSRVLNLSPGLTFTRLANYVFFNEDSEREGQKVLPVQSSGQQIIFSPEFRMSLTMLRNIRLSGQIIYTSLFENADRAISIPEFFANTQLAYENIFFKGNLELHAGIDLHWKSAYYAPGYATPIQQFYLQNTFKSPDFPLLDVFVNGKIKRGRIFIKYHNLAQVLMGQGYIPTPYYPGQANVIDFGFDWSFYD